MKFSRNYFFLLISLVILAGCGGKKKPSLAGEDPVEISDFIDFFSEKKFPYQFADSTLNKKEKDSLLIGYKVFTQFVPDSFMNTVFGKGVKPKIYPMGKLKSSTNGSYLFAKVIAGDKKAALILSFDKKDQFMDGIPVLWASSNAAIQQSVVVDKNFSISKNISRKNKDASTSEGKDVYGLDRETHKFVLIMTDAIDDKLTELVNPIDTASRKHKLAADYGSGKMNLVSIRDGRKADRLSFFIHFEKSNGECTGELKGEAIIKSATIAEYRQGGDPCVLRFTFTSSSVTLKEMEGCGSHRGLRCSFDGSYPRKKEAKAVKKKAGK
jgi:hypothetical protein